LCSRRVLAGAKTLQVFTLLVPKLHYTLCVLYKLMCAINVDDDVDVDAETLPAFREFDCLKFPAACSHLYVTARNSSIIAGIPTLYNLSAITLMADTSRARLMPMARKCCLAGACLGPPRPF